MNEQLCEKDWVSNLAGKTRVLSKHLDIRECFCKLLIILLAGLLLVGLLGVVAPTMVRAEEQGGLEITGDGVANPVSFTLEQLQAMEQYEHVYSTVNTWPTKRWYVGQGVKLRDLLARAGIKADAKLIIFTSSDGYSVSLTVKELLKDSRYYFPGLQENSASDGSIPGSPAGAQEVETILALLAAEGSSDPAAMNDMNALLLICGQRAVSEQTNNLFLKYINKIEVLTTEPPQWDKPRVNIGSGEVAAGTMLELNTKGSDTDKIYFTTDGSTPTINSPMFNWSAKRWWSQRPDTLSSINKAIEIKEGTVIKAITIGPGKADSEVVTFIYQIGDPDQPQIPGGPPTAITLDEDTLELKPGASFELAATVGPDNAVDKSVTWFSSNTSVAVVDNNGLVTVVGSGTAVITVKTVAGGLTASCKVAGINKDAAKHSPEDAESSDIQSQEQANPVEPEVQGTPMQTVAEPELSAEQFVDREEASDFPGEQQVLEEDWQYLAVRELPEHSMNSVDSQAGQQAWQVYEVSSGGVLSKMPDQAELLNNCMAAIAFGLFLTGAGRRYGDYKKEVAR